MSSTNLGVVGQNYRPLYDTLTFAAGAVLPASIDFFGSTDGKKIYQTNLKKSRSLNGPNRFLVKAIRLFWSPRTILADLFNIIENYIGRLYVGETDYSIGGIEYFPGGGGIGGMAAAATTVAATTIDNIATSNGIPAPSAIMYLPGAYGVEIPSGQNFWFELAGNPQTLTAGASGGKGLWMRCYLEGIEERPGQA